MKKKISKGEHKFILKINREKYQANKLKKDLRKMAANADFNNNKLKNDKKLSTEFDKKLNQIKEINNKISDLQNQRAKKWKQKIKKTKKNLKINENLFLAQFSVWELPEAIQEITKNDIETVNGVWFDTDLDKILSKLTDTFLKMDSKSTLNMYISKDLLNITYNVDY